MIDILAHRANVEGPKPVLENSLAATQAALESGFGIETEFAARFAKKILHRLTTRNLDAAKLISNNSPNCSGKFSSQPIAMNVKELGYEADLIALQKVR